MIDIVKLVAKYSLVSDQVSKQEITIVLNQLQQVLSNDVVGDVVELGCYKGATSLFLARLLKECLSNKKLWLYDSFQGLPEKSPKDDVQLGDSFQVGELAATKAEVLRNFAHANLSRPIIKKGWFSDLTDADLPPEICFAYLDGDYYDSIVDSFRLCQNKLTPGAVVVVDDYTNPQLPGVAIAVDEWCQCNSVKISRFETRDSLAVIQLVV